MCMGRSSSPPPPPPPPTPAISNKEEEQAGTKLKNQATDVKRRKEQVYGMGGKRKLYKKGGKSEFGMLSVKAGVDNNPNPTAADRIVGAKKMMGGGMKKMYQSGGFLDAPSVADLDNL